MAIVPVAKTTLLKAREASVDVLPGSPTWVQLDHNNVPKFGADVTTVVPRPISAERQRGKSVVTDLTSGVEVEHDLTHQFAVDFLEEFCFAEAANINGVFRAAPAVGGGTPGYTIPSATAGQAAKFQFVSTGPKTLVVAKGYLVSANNGLKVLAADLAAAGTTLRVAGVSAETPPSNAVVELAGIRAATGDLAITVSGATATLTSGNNGVTGGDQVNFTTIGIFLGQFIYLNGFAGAGFARVTSIAAASVGLDKLDAAIVTDNGTGDTVDVHYGRFIRNVASDHNADDDRFLQVTSQFELALPDLGGVGTPNYQYAKGNLASRCQIELPLTSIARARALYLGTDTTNPSGSRATGAATPILPLRRDRMATSSNVARIRTSQIAAVANVGFKDLTLVLDNNIYQEKVLGKLGALVATPDIFAVELSGSALFTEASLISTIRNSDTVTTDFILKNADGAVAIDLPSIRFGSGKLDFPLGRAVPITLQGAAHRDDLLGTSIGISFFPYLP